MLLIPDEIDLFDFFENEPIENKQESDVCTYKVTDDFGTVLILSFNEVEGSLQVRLQTGGNDVAIFVQEGATKLTIEDDLSGQYLRCEFDNKTTSTSRVEIRIKPNIFVNWFTLLK